MTFYEACDRVLRRYHGTDTTERKHSRSDSPEHICFPTRMYVDVSVVVMGVIIDQLLISVAYKLVKSMTDGIW